ncbi:uncharacterized protein [Miscanthus floridulus]|uniref:uncharacterized protein isoform X1 n=1 Tax=Miscanthus floridulus TaxID=154761 RepID=UPI0034586046
MRIMPSHPTSLRGRDSDDDDFRDRDYDVAALANNLSQAFRYGIYNNDDIEEAQGSHERDDEVSLPRSTCLCLVGAFVKNVECSLIGLQGSCFYSRIANISSLVDIFSGS